MFGRRVRTIASLVALIAAAACPPLSAQDAAGVPSFAEPGISPDHSEIAFVSGGEIWSVPSGGGTARILAAVDGAPSRPLFSPDGKRLAFVATKPTGTAIFVMTIDGGALHQVTHGDIVPTLSGWAADGQTLLFSVTAHNVGQYADVYRVGADGGTPMPVRHEDYVEDGYAASSPDGAALAYVRGGFPQWWRRGHSHMDQSAIVVARDGKPVAVTDGSAKDRWPMWAPDASTLYFVSDRTGSDELWSRSGAGALRRLTSLRAEPVVWPSIARDGKLIAFEHAGRIWTCDPGSGETRPLHITLRGLPAATAPEHVTLTSRLSALDLSPDGKKVAFVARSRVFAASADEGGDAQAVPAAGSVAHDLPVWAAGSKRVAFVVDRGDTQAIATYDFPDGPERVLTPAGHHDDYPHWSPDGKSLAFVRDGRELHLVDAATHADRILAQGYLDRRPFGDVDNIAFSPAGDMIAYGNTASGAFVNVFVVPVAGGAAHQITFLPNQQSGSVVWSPDSTRIYFVTGQRTEQQQVAQIDLIPRRPRFREDQFRKLFDEPPSRTELPSRSEPAPSPAASASPSARPSASPAAKPKPAVIVYEGIRERATLLPIGLDVQALRITPDGKTLVVAAASATGSTLYAYSVDDTSDNPVARQLTTSPGTKTALRMAPDGKTLYALDAGRITVVDIGKGTARALPVSAETDVSFVNDRDVVFAQSWSLLDRWFADPHFHGADWAAVRRTYEPRARGARTPAELRRTISQMLGELNASHLGIGAPRTAPRLTTGRLVVDWDAAEYARNGALRVAHAVPLGPLALAGVSSGDVLTAVEGIPVGARTDLDALLANRIGKRTVLRFERRGEVAVQPVDGDGEAHLRYRAWVAGRRAYVERVSGGRFGYVHIEDMSSASLDKFYTDLDTQNRDRSGVVVDVRFNSGGFIDPYLTDVLARREYLSFRPRFGPASPERTGLGQRALNRPTVLVVNEHSLSDAENFTEMYRRSGAGPVVGVPTAGWIIFTSGTTLADGSTLRLPAWSVLTPDGQDLEMHPRPVDVHVENPPGAFERGEDPQLDAAVRALARRVR